MLTPRALLLSRLAAATATTAGAGDGLGMNPALWHTRIFHATEVTGMPRMPARSRANRECYTDDTLAGCGKTPCRACNQMVHAWWG